jgi:microcystin-dependent protein
MTSYCRTPVTYTAHQRAIVGDTKMSVIQNDHLGWLICDGRTLNVNDFYLLWRVIGYSFGSNGTSNTFKLPDAAGRVPGTVGTGTDVNNSTFTVALGASIGEYVHTLTIAEMPTHNHGITDPGHTHGASNALTELYNSTNTPGSIDNGQNELNNCNANTLQILPSTTGITINSNGGSNAHNNIQPMIGIGNMFIFSGKYNYPSDTSIPFAGYPYLSNSQIL